MTFLARFLIYCGSTDMSFIRLEKVTRFGQPWIEEEESEQRTIETSDSEGRTDRGCCRRPTGSVDQRR
jgi:hypothetical protein